MPIICLQCGSVNERAVKTIQGSFLLECFLWLLFILPGVIYSVWRLTTKGKGLSSLFLPRDRGQRARRPKSSMLAVSCTRGRRSGFSRHSGSAGYRRKRSSERNAVGSLSELKFESSLGDPNIDNPVNKRDLSTRENGESAAESAQSETVNMAARSFIC